MARQGRAGQDRAEPCACKGHAKLMCTEVSLCSSCIDSNETFRHLYNCVGNCGQPAC